MTTLPSREGRADSTIAPMVDLAGGCARSVRSALRSLAGLLAVATAANAAIPPVEKLLPADTLFVIAIPDCARMRALSAQSPWSRCWHDPAMRPFREKFTTKWKEDFVSPLERDLGIKFADFGDLPRGAFALAVTQNGWQGKDDAAPGFLLLLDTKDQSPQLKKILADLRKKWLDGGRPIKVEKVRDVEFSVVSLASNDVPQTLRNFFPQRQEILELGRETEKKSASQSQLVVGQVESLLLVGSSLRAVEKVVLRLAGSPVPALADDALFEANRLAVFRDAPIFGWFNARPFFDALARAPADKPNPQAPSPVPMFRADKFVAGSGFAGLKSAAFSFRAGSDGTLMELFLGVPESARQGIFKMLAAEAKDSNPPAFVPADVVKFQRWRLDGRKVLGTLEAMIAEISPQLLNTWNFLINSGEEAVKQEDPTYDLRKNLFANLGDDLITYEKAPRGKTPEELESPPSLLLIGSPNADQLVKALRGALVIRSADALKPRTREFLGRTIFSISLPVATMPGAPPVPPRTLSYAASGGYVGLSTDVALLEEYLRSAEGQAKSLRETPGLNEAAQKVGGQNTGWFGYENQCEAMRVIFETLRKSSPGGTNSPAGFNPLVGTIPYARPERSFKEWMDFSLLPDFDRIAKYFHYTVYSGGANVDGLTFKFFSPVPPR